MNQARILKIDHVSINVVNIEKTLDFYGRILGFTRLQTVDCGDFDITYFAMPGGGRLEVFDYHGKNPAVVRQEAESGLRHLAFEVEDVDAQAAFLREAGVEITLSPTDLPNLGARVMLFADPNGIILEFCKPF